MAYQHLTLQERERLYELVAQGATQLHMAETLGRSRGTISRELSRNKVNGRYSPHEAQRVAQDRRSKRPIIKKLDRPEILKSVREGLAKRWSPEQIAERLRLDDDSKSPQRVSRGTIYRWLWSANNKTSHFQAYLRHGHYRRRGSAKRRIAIRNRVSIDQRPAEVDTREQVGHWEGDTVVGSKQSGYLVTLVERSSGLLLMMKTESKEASVIKRAIIRRLTDLPKDWCRTLTVDNGTEFAMHESITRRLELPIYFAHPYSSYERGSNENCNGLIRQFFPKGSDFGKLSHHEVARVEAMLNNRPRQRLDYLSPYEFCRFSEVALEM
jgi:IS30 family transposase